MDASGTDVEGMVRMDLKANRKSPGIYRYALLD
jgi:hypothetical protein